MESLYQKINDLEALFKKELKFRFTEKIQGELGSIDNLFKELSNPPQESDENPQKREKIHKIEDIFTQYLQDITKKFQNLVNLTKKLEADASPRELLIPKLDEIFNKIAEENVWAIDIYNEIVNDLKVKMEMELIDVLEKQLFGLKDSFGKVEKISGIVQKEFLAIQEIMQKVKQESINQVKSLNIEGGINQDIFLNITNQFEKLKEKISEIQKDIQEEISSSSQLPSPILTNLKNELDIFEKQQKEQVALQDEKIKQLSHEISNKNESLNSLETKKTELEHELANKSQALENKIIETDNELKLKSQTVAQLESELETLREELETKIKVIEDLESSKVKQASDFDTLIKTVEQKEETLSTELDLKNQTIAQLEADLESQKGALETKTKAIEDLEDSKAKQASDFDTLMKDIEQKEISLANELESKTQMIEQLENDNSKLLSDLEEKSQNLETLHEKLTEFSQNIDAKDKIIEELEQSKEQLKEKLEQEVGKQLEGKIAQLELELQDVQQFLESSPKYQFLYLINNLGESSLQKIKELTNFDDAVIRFLMHEMVEKDFITITGEGEDITVKVKTKLNPLSLIKLKTIYENETVNSLKNYSDLPSFEKAFEEILPKINQYKENNRQEAGYLVSVLYLFIHVSGNFHLFNKLQDIYLELRPESFYIHLIENVLNTKRWVARKTAELEKMIDNINLKIYNKNLKILEETDENYPQNGPFHIKTYQALSITEWSDEIKVDKTNLNYFPTLNDVMRWIWLKGQGTQFKILIIDRNNREYELIISPFNAVNAQLIIKEQRFLVN